MGAPWRFERRSNRPRASAALGPGARPTATASGSARAARRRRAQSTRGARFARGPGACVAPELRDRQARGPNRLARGPEPSPRLGRRPQILEQRIRPQGSPLRFFRFFFKSCARLALTRLAKFLFFGKPRKRLGRAGGRPWGSLGESSGMAWPNHPDFVGRPSPIPVDPVVPLRRRREARRRIPMFCLKDRPEEALTLPWLASFRQEGQRSNEAL